MRQPIGLYLMEFAPLEPAEAGGAGLPSFDAVSPQDAPAAVFDFEAPVLDFDTSESLVELDATSDMPALADPPPPEPDIAAIVEALEAEHATALAAARRHWVEHEGATLAAQFAAAMTALETRITDTLAPLLEPFLVQAAQRTALTGLREALGTLLAGPDGPIVVGGPADLLDALRDGLPERPGLTFAASDTPDVTITLGETRVRSQLAGWARALEAALLEAPFGAAA